MSEGWIKGMEMCAHLLSWGMLQPEHGGGQVATSQPVAYFEALPNEVAEEQPVTFDASGSYQYASVITRERLPESEPQFSWSFGDGTTGTGRVVKHAYAEPGRYTARLTVKGHAGKDAMTLPIVVVPPNFQPPVLSAPASDANGTFELTWTHVASTGLSGYAVEEARDGRLHIVDDAEGLAGWAVSEPTNPLIDRWQPSDSSTQKNRGNLFRSAPRSFLDRRLGDTVGWMGSRGYSTSWNGVNYWAHVGYPSDISGGPRPAFIGRGAIDSDFTRTIDRRDSFGLRHQIAVIPGQSGRTYFGW